MRFLSSSRLRIAFLALIIVTICVTFRVIGSATFARASGSQVSYPHLASAYQGSVHNITYNETANFALVSIKEDQQGNISGNTQVSLPLVGSGSFTGTVKSDNTITFTSTATDGSGATISFTGTVSPQNSLSGNYTVDNGQIGTWQVSTTSTSSSCPAGTTLSGSSWTQQFPTSTSTADLNDPFRTAVNNFLSALSAAGASVTISATYRPLERAYLMHYSFVIAKQGYDPRKVPAMADVPICWVYTNPDGSFNQANSKNAAGQMVTAYGITSTVPPSLTSNHTKRLAIDMTISWSGTLTITDAKGNSVTISSGLRSGMNPALWKVGASYGVLKFCYGIAGCQPSKDVPHWSVNGR